MNSADPLATKKANRFRFMNALYEKTNGDQHEFVDMWEVGASLGLSREETERVVQYLAGEHLLEEVAMGGLIAITHYGVVQVEQALSQPERSTQYFPPVVNIVHIGTMTGSSVQQAGSNSRVIAGLGPNDLQSLRELTSQLREATSELRTQTPHGDDLDAHVTTLEAQLRSSVPNQRIVHEAMATIRNVLEGMTGSILASGLLQQIVRWMGT
jgi:hypothetical protein